MIPDIEFLKNIAEWNSWRENNLKETINLTNQDLQGLNLRKINLRSAKLSHSNLREIKLSKANLNNALLLNSNLRDAVLFNASIINTNFKEADLKKADLRCINGEKAFFVSSNLMRTKLQNSILNNAEFGYSNLRKANFENADLRNVNFYMADLRECSFKNANLEKANLVMANLTGADFTGANLKYANLQGAQLIQTNLNSADLTGAKVYGISVWKVSLNHTKQSDLIITAKTKILHPFQAESTITVDNLEVAQFVYLLLNNKNIRNAIDTITSKVVLILGRFTPERKIILDAIREELRTKNYLPVLFDFDPLLTRDITETISTLAHLAKFIIADLSDAKSIPQELQRIIPDLPSVPVQPLLHKNDKEYGMYEHFKKYPWVLPIYIYDQLEDFLKNISLNVIIPAEEKLRK